MRAHLLLALAAPLFAGGQILAPADQTTVAAEVRVIARHDGKPEILIDGKPLAAESPHRGILHLTITLAAGAHEIALEGGPRIRVHSGPGAPASWPVFRAHPPGGAACTSCHAVRSGEWAFAKASLVSVCFACHDREAFPRTHTHEPGIVPDCQMCHSPHGSASAGHLKLGREAACKLCHN